MQFEIYDSQGNKKGVLDADDNLDAIAQAKRVPWRIAAPMVRRVLTEAEKKQNAYNDQEQIFRSMRHR